MRVAHVTTIDLSLRHLLFAQLQASVAAGDEVIGISAPGPAVAELEAAGIRHVALPSSTRGMDVLADVRAARELWRVLRRERPDVLHTHNPKPGLYGRILGRAAGVPIVVNTVHGLWATEDDPLLKRAVVYGVEVVASRFSDAELVQNPEDHELMRRWHLVPRRRLQLLGNGVDLERFDAARFGAEHRARLRDEWGAGDRVVVGIVGRLVAEKGYPELFEAVEALGDGFLLVVIGPDDPDKPDALDPAVVRRAEAAGVRFLGFRTDVDSLYPGMDVYVLPSHREGFPRSAMEAAAMELPVVTTDVRGCRQVVADGVNGILVPPRAPAALEAALRRLGDDPELRRAMGRAGRTRAKEHFDERRVVEIVLDTYRQAAGGPATRRPRRRPVARALKRAVDVFGAAVGLVVLAPVLAVLAALVRLRLGRPVLFVQRRAGHRGAPFDLVKFRTMTDRRDARGEPLPDEQRLTRLGRWMRATSLDELPELVNVLRGDMSLVGPRPLLVDYVDRYSPEQARRLDVRPGLTGWAAVNGRNATSWDDRHRLDVWYVDNWSLALDLRIMARTVTRVVRRDDVEPEGATTMPPFRAESEEAS